MFAGHKSVRLFLPLLLFIVTVGIRDLVDKGVKSLTGLDLDNLEIDLVIDAVYNIHLQIPTGSKKDGGKIG